ncbi:flagellar brake protein [Aliikangiella coralliicola]|uniref:Flagellar brake protein n=1 Tax=Aliikangiella coralliicola TaxID=2592383 RepID=A0A545UAM2_9GAMM|nr:flagellar brake protein [Aliikangiella coralliicola]TQV86511.1 flagellar brake protein [Aliikangiella coralliicola]
MRVEELGLAVGDALQLQIGDNIDQRYPVRFYGINPKGSVIVSAPQSGADKMIFVREGLLVTLRFVAKNVASGFTTRVLVTRGHPYPYLHLEIPKEIQTVEVRKEVRVETEIPVTVINKTHSSPALTGRMLNMSCSGGRIETNMKIALQNNLLNVTMKLLIEDIERLVTMDCLVTYVKEVSDDLFTYGLNIEQIDDEDMVVLRGFVYQELLKSLHMI